MEIPEIVLNRIHQIETEWPQALTTIYGPDTRIIYASENHIDSGWTQDDMIGSHWTKYVPPSDYPHAELGLMDTVLNQESTEITVTGLTKFGQQLRMRVKGWRQDDPKTGETYILIRVLLLDMPTKPAET